MPYIFEKRRKKAKNALAVPAATAATVVAENKKGVLLYFATRPYMLHFLENVVSYAYILIAIGRKTYAGFYSYCLHRAGGTGR